MIPLKEIEAYFDEYAFSKEPIKVNGHTTITDLETFVKTHINILKSNKGNKRFMSYYERLYKIYLITKI